MNDHIIDYSENPPLTLAEWAKRAFTGGQLEQEVQRFNQEQQDWLEIMGPMPEPTWRERLSGVRYRLGQKIVQFGEWVGG